LKGFNYNALRYTIFAEANLSNANLRNANLERSRLNSATINLADLSGANLRFSNLKSANLSSSDLERADISNSLLRRTNLRGANIKFAKLLSADLYEADLTFSDLTEADLRKADLTRTLLIKTNLTNADITDCCIYGAAVWDVCTAGIKQENLIITQPEDHSISVDNLELAQFVYLLLHNDKINGVIDTIGEKGVLILGRFKPERKAVLDAIRDKLRVLGFIPIMFDFDPSDKRDFTETIRILAGMSRFIIADISEPKCIPMELQAIVPDYAIPMVPIFHVQQGKEAEEPFAMIKDLQKHAWVFDVLEYETPEILLDSFEKEVVNPAKDMADSLLPQKAEGIRKRRLGKGR
jgi:hypothetical protein